MESLKTNATDKNYFASIHFYRLVEKQQHLGIYFTTLLGADEKLRKATVMALGLSGPCGTVDKEDLWGGVPSGIWRITGFHSAPSMMFYQHQQTFIC